MGCFQYQPFTGQALAVLQRHLPTGPAWDAYRIQGKNFYKLWGAIAQGFTDASVALCRLVAELNPYTTDELLPEWEAAVSLPDACLPRATTLEERRAWVLFRLKKKRWTTAQDWRDLAFLFGLEIEITPGWYVQKPALYAFEYPKRYDRFPKLGRFRVYIDILNVDFGGYGYGQSASPGYPVEYGLPSTSASAFQCLIDRVKPANVVVIWNDNPLRNGCYAQTFTEEFESTFCGLDT